MKAEFGLIRLFLLGVILSLANPSYGESELARYLYQLEVGGEPAAIFNEAMIRRSIADGDFDLAIDQSEALMMAVKDLPTLTSLQLGKVLSNHGAVLIAGGRYPEGVAHGRRGLDMLDAALAEYDEQLVNALTSLSLGLVAQNRFDEAKDKLHRAQHIVHRIHGIRAGEQLRLLAYLAAISVRQGDTSTADQQQRFALMVTESSFSGDSPDLVPGLLQLANYFSARGSSISRHARVDRFRLRDELFQQSTALYERAARIIETHYGANDVRLAPALAGLSHVAMARHQKFRQAEKYLIRRVEVIQQVGEGDIADVARAMLDLGDLQLLASDSAALDTYLEVWQMLQGRPESEALARQWFAQPKLVVRTVPDVLYLGRRPDAADPGEPLFADLKFDVSERGVVKNFDWVDKNVPLAQIKWLRGNLRSSRYRPAIEDGEFVTVQGVEWRQQYKVARRAFSSSIGTSPLVSRLPRNSGAATPSRSPSRLSP